MCNKTGKHHCGSYRCRKAAGVEVNEVDDLAAFQARMEPVWDEFILSPRQKELVEQTRAIGQNLEGRT